MSPRCEMGCAKRRIGPPSACSCLHPESEHPKVLPSLPTTVPRPGAGFNVPPKSGLKSVLYLLMAFLSHT
ncbi:hypothetical protein GQ607_000788 [Colletotrichum asianum]|uniref:Uncharacterized protein n=1 Tax=Colletotrichum asianum TaxID=702518 RepID=A0A8H3WUY3_9PEZI|nr:hypothetical protein GQ607_000788 [Colletotrichum asianum]